MRVLFLVIDGVSPRHVGDEVMPVLTGLARSGGWSREGGIGVLPTSTYPNHATFVTGVAPSTHGIVANEIPTPERIVPSWEQGPSSPTLFDSMRTTGRPSAAVFGDQHLVGVTGAALADTVWPDGAFADDVDLDVLGYAKDRETAAQVLEVVGGGAELIVAQLNESDTVAHIFGPDSPEALHRYRRADAVIGSLADSMRGEWGSWVVIVLSDHSQETVTGAAPVDLRAAAGAMGLAGLVVDEGAVAVAAGEMARSDRWMAGVPGVEGTERLDRETVLAWSEPGRWFSSVDFPLRGVHGSPRTAPQVAVVTGGHPAAARLGHAIDLHRPASTGWAKAVADLLAVPVPADLVSTV